MDKIELKNALPEVFALRDDIRSEIWHREVTFERGHLYLVEAGSVPANHPFAVISSVIVTTIRVSSALMGRTSAIIR